jgi:FkbM family methyltransferase
MIRRFLKRIPGTKQINQLLLKKKIETQFLRLNEIEIKHAIFYSQFIQRSDLVFDVGANVGCRTKLFLNLGASVVAFEPQPELCEHLNSHLKRNKRFTLEKSAIGTEKGFAEMRISDAHVLSSMSNRWIEATKKSGRFQQYEWNKSIQVEVTTFDKAIHKHGLPQFVKIDVEGFELDVLKGLSHQIRYISFEFTAEDICNTYNCIKHLSNLGKYEFRISKAESFIMEPNDWVDNNEIENRIEQLISDDPLSWGDIYARKND